MDPQSYGSATTYARRYALAAMIGIVADDDDGNAAARPAQSAAANDEPAARAKLDGPHTSKTALRTAVHAIIAKVRAAQSSEEIDAIQKENIATIKQANKDWPTLLTGDPNIEEDIGLKGAVEQRRAALASGEDETFQMLLGHVEGCDTLLALNSYLETNDALIGALDGEQSRLFQEAWDKREAAIKTMDQVRA